MMGERPIQYNNEDEEEEDASKKWDWLHPPTAYLLLPPYEPEDRNERILLRRARLDLRRAIIEKEKEESLEEPEEIKPKPKPRRTSSIDLSKANIRTEVPKPGKLTGAQIAEAAKAKVEDDKIDKIESQYIELEPVQEFEDKIEEYVQQSLDFYDHYMDLADEAISNVQVAVASRARANCANGMDDGDRKLQELKDKAKKLDEEYKNVTKDWITSSKGLLPQELYFKLREQEKKCEDFLEEEESFKNEIRQMIEDGDENLERLSALIDEDFNIIVDRIKEKFVLNNQLLRSEAMRLDERIEEEFKEMSKQNHEEIMGLIDDYSKLEDDEIEDLLSACTDTFEKRMERKLKMKERATRRMREMDDDIHALRMVLSGLEAAILKNVQNLQYNLWVLKKRNHENAVMLPPLQSINFRQEDRLQELKKNIKNFSQASKKKYKLRLAKIAALRKKYAEILPMHLHSVSVNYRKFMDLWVFSEEDIRNDIKEILRVRKYIKENYFGLRVVDPDFTILDKRPKEVQEFMDRERKAAERRKNSRKPSLFRTPEFKEFFCNSNDERTLSYEGVNLEKICSTSNATCANKRTPSKKPSNILKEYSPFVIKGLMKYIAKIVCDQSPFLIEQQIRQVMTPMITKEKTLVLISTVLEALNVTDVQEMEILSRYLLNTGTILKATATKFSENLTPDISKMRLSAEGILVNNEVGVPQQERTEEHWVAALQSKIAEGSKPVLDVHHSSNETLRIKSNATNTKQGPRNPLNLGTTSSHIVEISSPKDFGNIESITDIEFKSLKPSGGSERHVDPDSVADLLTPVSSVSTPSVIKVMEEFSSDRSLAAEFDKLSLDSDDTILLLKDSDSESTPSICSCEPGSSEEKLVVAPTGRSVSSQKSGKKSDETLLELIAKNSDVFRPLSPRIGGKMGVKNHCKPKPPKAGEIWKSPHAKKTVESSLSMNVCSPPEDTAEESVPLVVVDKPEESNEFLYIDLNDVLKALIAFCKDSSEIREPPSEDDIIMGKIEKLKVPQEKEITEYWHRFYKLYKPKRKEKKAGLRRKLEERGDDRESIWKHFPNMVDEYEKNLKKRNQTILEMKKVYKENVELSRLLGQYYHPNMVSRLSRAIPRATSYCQMSTKTRKP